MAHTAGRSYEIGAFVAGVSLATHPIAQYIAVSLRPLRDFFLVLFFFSVGAGLDMLLMLDVLLPIILLAVALVAIKPAVFAALLRWQGETAEAAHVVQGATVLSLIASTYVVTFRYPSPIAVYASLRRD